MINKRSLSEEDIKRLYITEKVHERWDPYLICMEVPITEGQVNIKGNRPSREAAKRADYVLYQDRDHHYPIAVIEAKDNNHNLGDGMQQAIAYAKMLDIPFAYSSNGNAFLEHDFLTGKERLIALGDFPSLEELKARLQQHQNFTPDQEKIIEQPYYSDQKIYPPRYYQRIAINRTVEAIAGGRDRILLVMATGTGKTYTAFQIVYRLLQSGLKHKILYLADRNILVDQTIQQDFAPLEKVTHKIKVAKENKKTLTSHQVYFALYQQLIGDDDEEHFSELFQPDFFDLIIVDECHRGSAAEASRWRRILEYFKSATQIGMTATPKETKDISNLHYFGEPIYTYSLKEGIQDGFLAPFKVINVITNISDEWRPYKGQVDKNGVLIPDRIYNCSDYDYNIVIEDWTQQVAREITNYLKKTDRMAKTIVFCASEEAAERMRQALVNLNSDLVRQNPDYVVRITGSDAVGKSKLDYFISVSSPYPVIATTSKLLTTGADCKMTKLIVLDQKINSMTEFKQIIGRGTRLRFDDGKTHFVVMDFRHVTRLFADPDWDGPIENTDYRPPAPNPDGNVDPPDPPTGTDGSGTTSVKETDAVYVDATGCKVHVWGKQVSVYDSNGNLLKTTNIIDYTKGNILQEYASLQDFITTWSSVDKKREIADLLKEQGIDLTSLKEEQGMTDVDDFDFICHVAYGQKPLTRRERAENVKKNDFFSKYKDRARDVLEALLDKYADTSIYELEEKRILTLDPLTRFGRPPTILSYFGSREAFQEAVRSLEAEIYKPSLSQSI
jgi:type I restriction enzyme R subunit